MSQHDEHNAADQVLTALRRDTRGIRSPATLDQQILSQAADQAALNAQTTSGKNKLKRRFGFWHYCAAASAAGFLLVATSYLVKEPAMMDAAQPQRFSEAVIARSATQLQSPQPATATDKTRSETAVIEERRRQEQDSLARETQAARQQQAFAEKSSLDARQPQQARSQSDQSASEGISIAGAVADAVQPEHGQPAWLADASQSLYTLDCQLLSIPDALSAQRRFLDAATQRALSLFPQRAIEIEQWRTASQQQIDQEQTLYRARLSSPSAPAAWRENWWREAAPEQERLAAPLAERPPLKCLSAD